MDNKANKGVVNSEESDLAHEAHLSMNDIIIKLCHLSFAQHLYIYKHPHPYTEDYFKNWTNDRCKDVSLDYHPRYNSILVCNVATPFVS